MSVGSGLLQAILNVPACEASGFTELAPLTTDHWSRDGYRAKCSRQVRRQWALGNRAKRIEFWNFIKSFSFQISMTLSWFYQEWLQSHLLDCPSQPWNEHLKEAENNGSRNSLLSHLPYGSVYQPCCPPSGKNLTPPRLDGALLAFSIAAGSSLF